VDSKGRQIETLALPQSTLSSYIKKEKLHKKILVGKNNKKILEDLIILYL